MPNPIIANDQPLVTTLVGIETTRGTAVTPTAKWYGQLQLDRRQDLTERLESNGTFFGETEAVRGAVEVGGNFSAFCTYEDLPAYLRLLVKGGGTGSGDGGAPVAYTYTKKPSGATDDLDTATVETNFPAMPQRASMFFMTEGTIRADIDDAEAVWMFDAPNVVARELDYRSVLEGTVTSATATTIVDTALTPTLNQYQNGYLWVTSGTGKGQVRLVSSNTTGGSFTVPTWDTNPVAGDRFVVVAPFTTGITDRTREVIEGPGTRIYVDRKSGGTIGATLVDTHAIPLSFSVTYRNNAYTKRGLSNVSTASTKLGRGFVQVRGQLRMEDESPYAWQEWTNKRPQLIRIEQTGTTIHTGPTVTKRARIDVYNAVFDTPTSDLRNQNKTKTWPFWGYLDATQAAPIQYEVVNALSTLP